MLLAIPENFGDRKTFRAVRIFTALHVMQTRYCEEISVRPSVRLSVRHTRDP